MSGADTPSKPDLRTRFLRLKEILFSTYDDEWWNVVFARPMAMLALVPIADIEFITPNLITVFDIFLMVIFLGVLYVATPSAYVLAAVLILVIDVVDAMDGHLARYRKQTSAFGGYLDKVADHYLWAATFAILGYNVYSQTGSLTYLFLGFATGIAITLRAYVWWIWRAEAAKVPEATIGTFIVKFQKKTSTDSSNPTPNVPKPWELRTQLFVFEFSEGDLYFWIALFLLLGRPDILLWFVALTQGFNTLLRLIQRGYNMHLLDEYKRKRQEEPQ